MRKLIYVFLTAIAAFLLSLPSMVTAGTSQDLSGDASYQASQDRVDFITKGGDDKDDEDADKDKGGKRDDDDDDE